MTWRSFEIHPETPAEGVPLASLFPGRDMGAAEQALAARAAEFDLPYSPSGRLSNSRLAIEATEYARDAGRFEPYHRAVFEAYFAAGEDIGDLDVLLAAAREVGLPEAELAAALESGRYVDRREDTVREAGRHGFSGVPAFAFARRYAVIGAQPLDRFREVLERIREEEPDLG